MCADRPPNIIYIYADDLGRGMLSCYGQSYFSTPHIDRLAREGMRFTHAYGCAVCAPARASLLSGYHDCHAGRWSFTKGGVYMELSSGGRSYAEIRELINNTSFTEREDELFLPQILQQAGYVTGQIGKLEWGFATTPERLCRHGWDYHYGYYDHNRCHGFYPPFLFENGERVDIEGNTRADCGCEPGVESPENRQRRRDRNGKAVYSQDLFNRKIVSFLRQHRDMPFFLHHPSQLPHGPIAVPEIHPAVRETAGLTEYEKEYASMVLRLDDTVGLILNTLEELNLAEDTLVLFASDNGHEPYYREPGRCMSTHDLQGRPFNDADYFYTSLRAGDVFDGNDGMAGMKLTSLEGGARIPFLAWGAGVSGGGRVSTRLVANYDTLPTLAELAGASCPPVKDGLSFLAELRGEESPGHEFVVFAGAHGPALVSSDGWKIRYLTTHRLFQLYCLPEDYAEERNLAAQHPERVHSLGMRLLAACDGNFHHGTFENHKAARIDEYMNGDAPEDAFPVIRK